MGNLKNKGLIPNDIFYFYKEFRNSSLLDRIQQFGAFGKTFKIPALMNFWVFGLTNIFYIFGPLSVTFKGPSWAFSLWFSGGSWA